MPKSVTNEELCRLAAQARENAYVPYSGFSVGAALLLADGEVITGCNIENAAFGPTVCAERVAIFKAVSEGKKSFAAIAVCGGRAGQSVHGAFPPCGVCRQVMAEFCSSDFPVLVVTDSDANTYDAYTLGDLLPGAFTPKNMN